MTEFVQESPIDCPVLVISNDEDINADIFAQLTLAGWGPSVHFAKIGDDLGSFVPPSYGLDDILAVHYATDLAEQSAHLKTMLASGVEPHQLIIGGPNACLAHRVFAQVIGCEFFAIDKTKSALGPVIQMGDVVHVVSNRIFSRLSNLMNAEVKNANSTGTLTLLKRLLPPPSLDPIERATIAAMIAGKFSNQLSFRRKVIRTALFRDILELGAFERIISEATHLWIVQETLKEVAIGSASLAAGTAAPMSISAQSWCVVAADLVLQDGDKALEIISEALKQSPVELRVALQDAVQYAIEKLARWVHASAS